MTPQLQQAIRLLALSNLEIEGFIAEELEKNPLLESGGGDDSPAEEAPGSAAEPEAGDASDEPALDLNPNDENLHQDSAADAIGGTPPGHPPVSRQTNRPTDHQRDHQRGLR